MNDSYYGSNGYGAPPPPPEGRPPLHTESNGNYRDDLSETSDPRYRPSAAPPAAAPPTPPPTPPSWKGKMPSDFKADYGTRSSQQDDENENNYSSGGGGTAAPINSFRGDATLRPNVGLTNSYEYALFGWTLQELIVNLRRTNLVATFLTLLWVLFSWLGKFFTFQITNLVLLGYLAVLSFALFLVDIMGFYRSQLSQRGITSNSSTHTFVMEERVRDQLGLLYHPGGKAGYLFFLGVLCWSIGDLTLRLIGLAYCFSAFGYVYAFNTYPEFRRGGTPQAATSAGAQGFWNKQAWTTTSLNGQGLAEAAARNWSTRWGLGTGPEEEPNETESFLRHNQANQTYTFV